MKNTNFVLFFYTCICTYEYYFFYFLYKNPLCMLLNFNKWQDGDWIHAEMRCLKVWLRLLFKVFFMLKCIKIKFFYFLKIIFEMSILKRFKKINFYKKKLIFLKTRIDPRFQMQTKLLVHYVHHKELLQ